MNKRFIISFGTALLFSVLTASFVYASVMPTINESSNVNDDINVKLSKTLIESSSVNDHITVKVFKTLNDSIFIGDKIQ